MGVGRGEKAHSATDGSAVGAPGEALVRHDSAVGESTCVGVLDCSAPGGRGAHQATGLHIYIYIYIAPRTLDSQPIRFPAVAVVSRTVFRQHDK